MIERKRQCVPMQKLITKAKALLKTEKSCLRKIYQSQNPEITAIPGRTMRFTAIIITQLKL